MTNSDFDISLLRTETASKHSSANLILHRALSSASKNNEVSLIKNRWFHFHPPFFFPNTILWKFGPPSIGKEFVKSFITIMKSIRDWESPYLNPVDALKKTEGPPFTIVATDADVMQALIQLLPFFTELIYPTYKRGSSKSHGHKPYLYPVCLRCHSFHLSKGDQQPH